MGNDKSYEDTALEAKNINFEKRQLRVLRKLENASRFIRVLLDNSEEFKKLIEEEKKWMKSDEAI